MASKIHMGDMPELMENILYNLNNEICSLYSCALVSRHWCKMAVPILWQDPFSSDQSPLFISKYFSSLGVDDKFILKKWLKEREINEEFSNTLFDYARFLKVLDIWSLESKVREWLTFKLIDLKLKLFYDTEVDYMMNLLFKLFIESGATLHKLVLEFSQSIELRPKFFYILEENKQFFSRIQHLSLDVIYDNNIESATILLRTLAESTTKINTIKLNYFDSNYELQIFRALIHIIKSQEQLRLFRLAGEDSVEFHDVISALESQKNSLQEVRLYNCDFSAEFEVFNNCKNLETLHLRYCSTKPLKSLDYKVSTLEVIESKIDTQSMALIFEKSGIFLQRLKLVLDEEYQDELFLLEALKSFCPNITYFSIQGIVFSPQLVELIGNLRKLQFLSLLCDDVDVNDILEEVLKIRVIKFSEILPLTLQYFTLRSTWLEPYTDILFNHCNAPLKKMLIYRINNERISKALVEFCMRNKSLNYVGVFEYEDLDDNTKKEMEPYVELVPYEYIVVD
ncbi:hypothetical protein C2G38_1628918 [Gigaspora rosea]|uniref:Uncharacterized protein n=1 Tax=Gigaspora rosea TaxID=44941 RepID=A0A397W8N5_9GLOM|nr:hypothetical protein C2G38_1628918 [Gigaspora rosea]